MHVSPSIRTALQSAVDHGVFPGAVLAIRRGGELPSLICAGRLSQDPMDEAVSESTLYDLASLTKPLATATSLALLLQEGRCQIDERLDRILPELAQAPIGSSTLRDLLRHSSGFPGWRPFYEQLSPHGALPSSHEERQHASRCLLDLLRREPLIHRSGAKSLYSDLGFMLLGFIIERLSRMTLDRFVADRIAVPLSAGALFFLPTQEGRDSERKGLTEFIAPTELDGWRRRLLRGEVHDENAAVAGGVAGHAGLFGTAESVLSVTGSWLRAHRAQPSFLDPDVVKEFTRRQKEVPGSSWALGWDTPSAPSSSGHHFSSRSFGHLGYTGTSVWIDPVAELEVVLLSNRVHPTRTNDAIRGFRPAIHDLIYEEVVGAP
ncbi:MAG: serine hydrolase [Nitrospiraceae bacterium]|nr:serine hydrolase [Nitrospiraceae bacterium]